jgi:hypothetical protein
MTTFEVLLIISLVLIVCAIGGVVFAILYKLKVQRMRDAILSHRELWLYYMDDKDLENLLSNNNGKDACKMIDPENMTEKQYRFLVLFLNHMEHMLPSWTPYIPDWYGLFKNQCLRKVYENTKLYRGKKFCKLIDSILASYEK